MVDRVVHLFAHCPELAAVFGSYDASPRAGGVVSRYRNLFHHFVHQHSNSEASTFWAGCGAIQRSVFQALGGFDAKRFRHASIEDIELGYRLRQAHYHILLDKALQGKHLKRWTFWSVIRTDVFNRAIPWSRLIMETHNAPADLNLTGGQRLSVALVGLATLCLLLAAFRHELLILWAATLLGVIVLNRQLFRFFSRQHGLLFATLCIPLHLLYYFYSGLSYWWVWMELQLRGITRHHPSLTQGLRRSREHRPTSRPR